MHNHSQHHQHIPVLDEQHHSTSMVMSPMFFHFGTNATILFSFWNVDSIFGIFCSCIMVMLACFCLEFIRWYRVYRKKQQLGEGRETTTDDMNGYTCRTRRMNVICDASLHAIQLALSYMLMLIFMTFNVWLGLAVIMGEVLARMILSLFFPQLDLFLTFISAASTEACCG